MDGMRRGRRLLGDCPPGASPALPAAGRPPCTTPGPLWTTRLPPNPAGGGPSVMRGHTYVVGPQIYLSCAAEKAALVRIFARWPTAARSGDAIPGGPGGWTRRANGSQHSGQCRRGQRAFFEFGPIPDASG